MRNGAFADSNTDDIAAVINELNQMSAALGALPSDTWSFSRFPLPSFSIVLTPRRALTAYFHHGRQHGAVTLAVECKQGTQ
jgi:hypothetical protein